MWSQCSSADWVVEDSLLAEPLLHKEGLWDRKLDQAAGHTGQVPG